MELRYSKTHGFLEVWENGKKIGEIATMEDFITGGDDDGRRDTEELRTGGSGGIRKTDT